MNIESEEEANESDEEGSLQDFVVDDDEAESQASYASSDSGIVAVSPPGDKPERGSTDATLRKSRLQELVASRARKLGAARRLRSVSDSSQSESEAVDVSESEAHDTSASEASEADL